MHHNYSQIATTNDTAIRGWDLKSMKYLVFIKITIIYRYIFANLENMYTERQAYVIDNAHSQLVRDIDFNPNKQYYMVSCGDDCKTKFWDIRKPTECLKVLNDHSHWY